MNSVRLVCDGGAGKVEGKGREMSQRPRARSGRSAAVRTLECRMIVECTDGPACGPIPVTLTLDSTRWGEQINKWFQILHQSLLKLATILVLYC